MCHLPRTAWQKVCTRPAGSIFTSSQWTNITPEVPIEVESTPRCDDAVADGPGRAIAGPAHHHAVGRQAQQFGRLRRELAGHFFRFVAAGQQIGVQFQLRQAAGSTRSAGRRPTAACRWRR